MTTQSTMEDIYADAVFTSNYNEAYWEAAAKHPTRTKEFNEALKKELKERGIDYEAVTPEVTEGEDQPF